MHSHDDRKIETCKICQREIREIEKAGEELGRKGVWMIPPDLQKRLKDGEIVQMWRKKEDPPKPLPKHLI